MMAQLITKSNTLRKQYKEKTNELMQIETELETKGKELRSTVCSKTRYCCEVFV